MTNPWSVETAEQRLNQSLERIADNNAETQSVFTTLFQQQVNDDLAALPTRAPSPLAGALVSIKALLDVKGEITHAGTFFLKNTPVATADAPAVARLREAGALLLGHTTMSELAYSGLGLNPHYGTADNPRLANHAPGGSSSGGAVSVATNLVDIAIGSDTGGSLRIPAAFCGITGFKPSQASVSREGAVPLSDSLDSIGPMAKTVDACAKAWQVMANLSDEQAQQASQAELYISRNFGFDQLDPTVAEGFDALINELSTKGVVFNEKSLEFLDHYGEITPWHLTSVECRAHFEREFHQQAELFDPRVYSRLARADELSAVEYRYTVNLRQKFAQQMNAALTQRVLVLPTVAILPPSMASLENDERFGALNLLALRNTTLANIGDGCSLALPYQYKGYTLSLMLIGAQGSDRSLLALGQELEERIANSQFSLGL